MDNRITPEIRTFLEKLLAEKKIHATGELKEMMLADLYDRLEVRFYQLVIEHLDVKELETLGELADKGQVEVQSFLRKTIRNIDKVFAEAMQEFGAAYLEG